MNFVASWRSASSLSLSIRPEMISFAGGLPNLEAFPTEALGGVLTKVIKDHGPEALQYMVRPRGNFVCAVRSLAAWVNTNITTTSRTF